MLLAQQIKKYRELAGLSQDQFAKKLYVTRQAVSKWESGESVPDLDKIIRMAKIFNISLDNLILDIDDQKQKVNTDEFVFDPILIEISMYVVMAK